MNTTPQMSALRHDDPAVLKHVEMYQGIITRMAASSSACKNWCVVLVSAFLLFVIKEGCRAAGLLALVPILLFWFLDGYYLGLEQQFRAAFNNHMTKLRNNELTLADLFVVKTDGRIPGFFSKALFSWATWPVYIALLVLNCIAIILS